MALLRLIDMTVKRIRNVILLMMLLFTASPSLLADTQREIFDGHIHYSIDIWDKLSPQEALTLLSEAGIRRAVVSASPGEGAERLYRAAPERIVPFLRPYEWPRHRYTWVKDASILNYLRTQLAKIPYRGIGEFHLSGKDARQPVVAQVVKLARERDLALHAHTDEEGIQVLLEQAIDIPVIWAHGGFDVSETRLRELLATNKHLYIELSFREGMTEDGNLTAVWYQLLTDYHSRFLIGMDTYTPDRWVSLAELADDARSWLQQLPAAIAHDIAYGNASRLFDSGTIQ